MEPIKDIIDRRKKESKHSKDERLEGQLKLVAGFDVDEKTKITLKELLERKIMEIPEFSQAQQEELTIERIKAQEEFKISIIDQDIKKDFDKEQAIEEIKNRTDFGKQLMKIEMRTLKFAFEQAKKLHSGGD